MTVDANTVSCHVLPPDATAQMQASGRRRKAVIASRIQAARSYAETARCGRSELLAYFGDHYDPACGRCDNDAATGTTGRAASHTDRPGPGRRVHHRLWGDGTLLDQDDYADHRLRRNRLPHPHPGRAGQRPAHRALTKRSSLISGVCGLAPA